MCSFVLARRLTCSLKSYVLFGGHAMDEQMDEHPSGQAGQGSRRFRFGEQSLWEAAPDVIQLQLVGTVDGPELAAILDRQREWGKDKARWFSLVDLSRFATSTPSSRAVIFEWDADSRATVIVFGLTFATRMLIDLTLRAKRRLRPDKAQTFAAVASEAEGWRQIERLRAAQGASG